MKQFTEAELTEYDGQNGKPVYIAHNGNVYDVSESKLWKTGLHMKRHKSGQDLTTDIQAAPHDTDVLERYTMVGELISDKVVEPAMPVFWAGLIDRYPMLRRHPHPMTVHFPIVFMISTTMFNILFLVTGFEPFETTAYHCLGGGVLFTLVASGTGFYTWWMNYLSQPMRAITIKKRIAGILFLIALSAFVWRTVNPGISHGLSIGGAIYFLMIFSVFPLVTINGWFGASLTFPPEKS